MMPYAILAGTECLLPSIRREALELEKPSLDDDVGMLKKGNFLRYAAYLAASITLPPPIPSIT